MMLKPTIENPNPYTPAFIAEVNRLGCCALDDLPDYGSMSRFMAYCRDGERLRFELSAFDAMNNPTLDEAADAVAALTLQSLRLDAAMVAVEEMIEVVMVFRGKPMPSIRAVVLEWISIYDRDGSSAMAKEVGGIRAMHGALNLREWATR